jgi:hypothetical protein
MKKMVSRILAVGMAAVMALSLASCGKEKTIEDYVASDEIQEQLESVKSSMASSGIDVDVIGEDNKLIYVYTYSDQFDEDAVDALAEQLESAMSAQASTFEDVAASLKEETDVEDPIVEVRYVNADGSEIYSQEFTAQ